MNILDTLRKIEEKIDEYSYNFDNALLEEINNSFKTLNDVKDPKTLNAIYELQNAKHSIERFLETHNDEYLDEYNKYFDSAKTLLGHIEANEVEKEILTSAFKVVAEKTNMSKNIENVIENAENMSQAASLITNYAKERLENKNSTSTKEKIIEILKNLPEDEVNTLFESGELFENVKDMLEDKNLKPDVILE